MWTPVEMTELLVGSYCATHIPVHCPMLSWLCRLPSLMKHHTPLPCKARHVQQHKFKLPSSSSKKNQSITGSTGL